MFTCTFSLQAQFWTQLGNDIDGNSENDRSGNSVCLNSTGDIVAIGSSNSEGESGHASLVGHVRVFNWIGSAWNQMGSTIYGEDEFDFSGGSVCLNSAGEIIAIGATNNNGGAPNSGHVRVFKWNGSDWAQMGGDIDGDSVEELSGWSVSLNSAGDIVAIGAGGNDDTGLNVGQVRIFEWTGSSWVQMGADIDGEAERDYSGCSVSLNSTGDIVAIGAKENDGNGSRAGHVRIYEWNEGTWIQVGEDIDGEASVNFSGFSVSLDITGHVVAIGAYGNSDNGSYSGHVRIYEWNGSTWAQKGSDINGEAYGDESGCSVSLNNTGDVVAIGARMNDGDSEDLYNDVGHVRIYDWDGSSWVQRYSDIDGEAASDASGWSVSLSSTGDTVAIGARYNGGNGTEAGHVRVFTSENISTDVLVSDQKFFSVYPNPVNSMLNIESGNVTDQYSVEIISLNGKLLFNEKIEGSPHQLDLSSLQRGVYFITIKSKNSITTKKIIKLQ